MKKRGKIEEIVLDVPIFYDEIPKETINKEKKKRQFMLNINGETAMLTDKLNFSGAYFLCRLKIDPTDKKYYSVQVPLGDAEKVKAIEVKLKYENLTGLKIKAEYSPNIISRKYRVVSK